MGFHENINLAATHHRQTPLMNDGVAKKSNTGFRGGCNDRVRNDRDGGNVRLMTIARFGMVRYAEISLICKHSHFLAA
jgi:hypothetical protein